MIRKKHVMNFFKVEKVAICGSDIALYLWNEVAKVIATVPFIPGKFWAFLVISGSDIALYLWNEVAKVIAIVPFIPGK